jgi:hypothetical protein
MPCAWWMAWSGSPARMIFGPGVLPACSLAFSANHWTAAEISPLRWSGIRMPSDFHLMTVLGGGDDGAAIACGGPLSGEGEEAFPCTSHGREMSVGGKRAGANRGDQPLAGYLL